MSGQRHPRTKNPERDEFGERELKSGVILARRRGGGLLPRELELNMQTAGVLLVAVESGAALPPWVGHCQDKVSDVFVLVGNTDEPSNALLKRVEQRVALLSESEHQLGLVVFVTESGCPSIEVEQLRMLVADRLLGYLARLSEGMLLLVTDENASMESRVQLLSMAGSLAQQVRGTKLSVSIRFGSQQSNEPPQEILRLAQLPVRRTSRRPPAQSGQMLKPTMVPPLRKAPAELLRRRLSNAG